jgi:YVTN family beta-propeller protein
MWAGRDNGRNVNWDEAGNFCKSLAIDGYSGWGLPSIQELVGLYDPSFGREYIYHGEAYNGAVDGQKQQNYVKRGVELNSCCAWSGTRDGVSNALYFRFQGGEKRSFNTKLSGLLRALCVRENASASTPQVVKSQPEGTLTASSPPTTFPAITATNFGVGGAASFVVTDGRSIWVAISNNTVSRLRASDGAVLGTFAAGNDPRGIALEGDSIWVTDLGDNTVRKLRASDGSPLGLYRVGRQPAGIAFDGANIWVAISGSNKVSKLRASEGTALAEVEVGASPVAVAFDEANIWVANSRSNSVTKVNARTNSVLGTFPVGSLPLGITFDGTNVWVANSGSNSVTKLRASDGTALGTFPVGIAPRDVAFDGMNVWVANNGSDSVTKLRASDGAPQGNFTVGSAPRRLVFDGSHVWVSTAGSNIARF